MQKVFEYLEDIPPLPNELISDIINNDGVNRSWHNSPHYKFYIPSKRLISWCVENIKGVKKVGIQEMDSDLPPHIDVGRNFAINYIVDTGGGSLCHYSSNKPYTSENGFVPIQYVKEISKVYVEPRRWHILDTSILHGVVGITGKRLSLTVNVDT